MGPFILTVTLTATACALSALGQVAPAEQPLATISGQPITQAEVDAQVAPQLRQLRNQEYEVRRNGLEVVISQRILELEAKRRGITTEALLREEVDKNIPEPSDGVIEGYYLAQRDRYNQPLANVRPQVVQALKESLW